MKRFFAFSARAACLLLLALNLGFAFAALPAPVAQALATAGIPEQSVALYIHEIGADRPAVSHAAERPFNPASTMKLVTTYAALDLLGPAYAWTTDVYGGGPIQGDTLAGPLIIKGYGDPKLTFENFWVLLRNVRARGVREIRGDLLLDRTYFATEDFDPSRFDGDPIRPYNTGPDALLVNFKAITVQFVPEAGGRVRLIAEPALETLQVINKVVLTDGACGDWVSRLKFEPQGTGDTARLVIAGNYPADCGERTRSFSLLNHRAYTGALFNQLWKDLGGSVTGVVRDGVVPRDARLLASARSPALSEVVRDINKYSNNVMARQLFLTLGAIHGGPPATLDKGAAAVRQWAAQKGLSMPELVIDNGSGLSRTGRISARSMGEMLLDAFRSAVMPEFISSLPVVAADGTMKKRLANAQVAGQAHIKGGTLEGVRAIAGYVLDAYGRRVVVVFMVNHQNAAQAQAAQDALLQWVHAGAGSGQTARPRKPRT